MAEESEYGKHDNEQQCTERWQWKTRQTKMIMEKIHRKTIKNKTQR